MDTTQNGLSREQMAARISGLIAEERQRRYRNALGDWCDLDEREMEKAALAIAEREWGAWRQPVSA